MRLCLAADERGQKQEQRGDRYEQQQVPRDPCAIRQEPVRSHILQDFLPAHRRQEDR
jgi:hypothetical protein